MKLGFVHAPVHTLGPGRRVGVWLQGCSKGCPGCMSHSLRASGPQDGTAITPEQLVEKVCLAMSQHECSGVTVSGGEPFEQAAGLYEFLQRLRQKGIKDILVYSGWSAEQLLKEFPWIPELVTCLVDGSFEKNNPSEAVWKGSDNQQMYLFSEINGYAAWKTEKKGKLQIAITEGDIPRIIGIPRDSNHLPAGEDECL